MNDYWDKDYPTHILVSDGYWESSHSVEYIESN